MVETVTMKMVIALLRKLLVGVCIFASITPWQAPAVDPIAVGARVTKFGTQLPRLIENGVELGNIEKGLTPLLSAMSSVISENTLKTLLNPVQAYANKTYTDLGLTQVGENLNAIIPDLMSALLATYPFVRLAINHFAYPIAQLTYDLGDLAGLALAKSISYDVKNVVESGIIDETYGLLNDLDNLLSGGLLPRLSLLFAELDVLIPEAMNIGLIALD